MDLLQRNFKIKVNEDLMALNGEEFERFSRFILELILNEKVNHKGQNLFAKPVGYTADFADTQYEIIGQSGTDFGYFDDFKKPLKDIESAIKNHSTAKIIYLFSNRYAGTSRLGDLIKDAKENKIKQKVIPYDSEKIAEIILDKIIASNILDEIFKYLPLSHQLYRILPKTAQLPAHKDTYYERIEEKNIIDKIEINSVIQIYGLSGIGKTEITIGVAQKVIKQYETILWIEGDSIQNSTINFEAIKISKFDKLINLSTILETYKVLVIFDNINCNVIDIKDEFLKHNKRESKCLITSLTKSLSEEACVHLSEVSKNIASKILFTGKEKNDEIDINKIISYTGKHPLILKIISSAIKNNIIDWDNLIKELQDVNRLTDKDKNQTISNRIIDRISASNEKELESINFINNRLISKPLLDNLIGKIGVSKLLDNSIIGKDDSKYYSVHQIIVDSLKSELKSEKWSSEFMEKLKSYLMQHNEIKDVGFYSVIFNHRNLLDNLIENVDTEFKRIIIYSIIQCTDLKNASQSSVLFAEAEKVIENKNTYYENLLSIELGEITLLKIDKKKEKVKYELEAEKQIALLTGFLNEQIDLNHKSTILHHIGKIHFKIGDNIKALQLFNEVLSLKPNDPYALLQIARIYSYKNDVEKVTEIAQTIFNLEECPLSILLSFYELISYNDYQDLKEKYIDNQIDSFVSKLIEALDSRYDQPYNIIAKISRHLSYNFPEYFESIIDNLPVPSNLDFNENLRFNFGLILSSYYKFGDKEKNKEKLKKAFFVAKSNLINLDLDSDYKKGVYLDLLISDHDFDNALIEIFKFENKNEFYFQKLSKIYRGLGEFLKAIESADHAISYHSSKSKKISQAYLAAFTNDKAESENGNNDIACIKSLTESIELQPNQKTKNEWEIKLLNWKEKFKIK